MNKERSTDPDRRTEILKGALEIFSERGFHGTSVPDIAERAGVSTPTLYRYFDGKEALVNAVFQYCKTQLGEALVNGFPLEVSVREQFHVFWRRLAAFAREHPAAFTFLELHHHDEYIDARSLEVEQLVHTAGRAFFEESRRRGETRDVHPEVLISLVWGAFAGIVKGAGKGRFPLDDAILNATEAYVWAAIRSTT